MSAPSPQHHLAGRVTDLTHRRVQLVVGRPGIDQPWKLRTDVYTLAMGAVLAVAAALRLWNLGSVPLGLHPDELAGLLGAIDFFSGHSGWYPLFNERITYLPLYGVCEYVSVWAFGNTPTTLRLPAAIFGILAVYFTGKLAYGFFRSRPTALLAAACMALLPWNIALSRYGYEPAAMLPFLIAGLWLLQTGLGDGDERRVRLAPIVLAVGAYAYRAEPFYATLLFAALLILFRRSVKARCKPLLQGLAIAGALVAPLAIAMAINPSFTDRDRNIWIFAHGLTPAVFADFVSGYLSQFAPGPLFFTGDGNLNHGPAIGVLAPWMAPFIVLSFFSLRERALRGTMLFLGFWLLIYPIGAALTNDGRPHFTRTLAGAPLFCLLAGQGLVTAWRLVQTRVSFPYVRTVLKEALVVTVLITFAGFCRVYYNEFPEIAAGAQQYADRDLFAYARAHQDQYDRVCYTAVPWYNETVAARYYLADARIVPVDGIQDQCRQPRSLFALGEQKDAPPDAHLVGSAQNRDGSVYAYFYAH